ncbi:hypothetical protein JCM10213_001928 [Rhodosporidiobolus nylandii]
MSSGSRFNLDQLLERCVDLVKRGIEEHAAFHQRVLTIRSTPVASVAHLQESLKTRISALGDQFERIVLLQEMMALLALSLDGRKADDRRQAQNAELKEACVALVRDVGEQLNKVGYVAASDYSSLRRKVGPKYNILLRSGIDTLQPLGAAFDLLGMGQWTQALAQTLNQVSNAIFEVLGHPGPSPASQQRFKAAMDAVFVSACQQNPSSWRDSDVRAGIASLKTEGGIDWSAVGRIVKGVKAPKKAVSASATRPSGLTGTVLPALSAVSSKAQMLSNLEGQGPEGAINASADDGAAAGPQDIPPTAAATCPATAPAATSNPSRGEAQRRAGRLSAFSNSYRAEWQHLRVWSSTQEAQASGRQKHRLPTPPYSSSSSLGDTDSSTGDTNDEEVIDLTLSSDSESESDDETPFHRARAQPAREQLVRLVGSDASIARALARMKREPGEQAGTASEGQQAKDQKARRADLPSRDFDTIVSQKKLVFDSLEPIASDLPDALADILAKQAAQLGVQVSADDVALPVHYRQGSWAGVDEEAWRLFSAIVLSGA